MKKFKEFSFKNLRVNELYVYTKLDKLFNYRILTNSANIFSINNNGVYSVLYKIYCTALLKADVRTCARVNCYCCMLEPISRFLFDLLFLLQME